jgi:GntR family transcriptional regulator, transcriptional repressor for pyruvate dehydrogenase complex
VAAKREPSPVLPWLQPLPAGRNFAMVVERLRRAIEDGGLRTGDKLPSEPELASLFSISRSAVREALKVLELSGYLEVRRGYGGGTFIRAGLADEFTTVPPPPVPVVSVTLRQLIEVRDAIEPFSAHLAADASAEVRDMLQQTAPSLSADHDRPAEILKATFDFHIEVARSSGNRVFVSVLETLRPPAYWAMRHGVTDDAWRSRIRKDHEAILVAIGAGDAERAEDLMRGHLKTELPTN